MQSRGAKRQLLVATDFSPAAKMAVERAARLPLARGARLHVLHVLPSRLPLRLRPPAETQAARWLAEAAEDARLAASKAGNAELEVVPALVRGQPYVEIIHQARRRNAALVIVGRHGTRPIRDLFIGSTAERVVREELEKPVLVVNGPAEAPYRRVLVGVDVRDDTSTARCIAELALALVDSERSRVMLVHAYDVPLEGRMRSVMSQDGLREYRKEWRTKASRRLRKLQSGFGPELREARPILRAGDPRAVIMREATRVRADLIALGTHARSGVAHALLGSVAEWVLRSAGQDVVVRHPPEFTFEAP